MMTLYSVNPRPSFSACVKAVRKASGDKRTYVERVMHTPAQIIFKYTSWQQYRRASAALHKLNPSMFEQFTADDQRLEITVSRRCCMHCGHPFHAHVSMKMQCLFASTRYSEKIYDEDPRQG